LLEQNGFSRIDRIADPLPFLTYLETVTSTSWAQLYKQESFDLLALEPGQRILEVGCGLGDDAVGLLQRVRPSGTVHAVDRSRLMIEEASRRWGASDSQLRFEVADAEALPFTDGSFDRARADRVFQHLQSPERALAELLRVTVRGGRIAISEPQTATAFVGTNGEIEAVEPGLAPSDQTLASLSDMFRAFGITQVRKSASRPQAVAVDAIVQNMSRRDAGQSAIATHWRQELAAKHPNLRAVAIVTAVTLLAVVP
jgi:ubiquinone/menaquinone biosynthesis C-methylase UbiE